MTLPIGEEDDFVGVVDVLSQKAYIWDDSGLPENYTLEDIPADMVDDAAVYREQMIETALEADEDLLMDYLEGELTPTEEQIKACIRKGTTNLCSSLHTVVQHSRTKVCSYYLMLLLITYLVLQMLILNH